MDKSYVLWTPTNCSNHYAVNIWLRDEYGLPAEELEAVRRWCETAKDGDVLRNKKYCIVCKEVKK